MKLISTLIFSILTTITIAQLPSSDWIFEEGFSNTKFSKENFQTNYNQIETLIFSILNNGNSNSFASISVYEDVILQHIDTSNHELLNKNYEWLENKYPNLKVKYAENINTISAEIKSIDKVYFRFEDTGNLLTGRASAMITTLDNETFVVIFKNLCKVNNEWHVINNVKLKPFNQ